MPDEIQGDSVSYYSKASELKTSVEKALDTFRQSVDTQVDEWETTRDKWEVGGLKPPEGVPTKECLSALETALGNCLTGIEEWTEDVPVMLGSHDDTLLYCKPRIMRNGMSFGVELSIGTHSTAMLDPKVRHTLLPLDIANVLTI